MTPPRIETDPAHGGRWTSLRAAGREWLWHREEPRRPGVRPGDAFADAGGLEECVPTIRGTPDHGDAWARPWQWADGTESVDCPDFRLSRRIRSNGGCAVADYRLTAEPGYRFLWAAHALFDLSEEAHIGIRDGAPTRFYPDSGARWTPCSWPSQPGRTEGLDRLGPDDGTAVGAIVDTPQVYVRDGAATLRMAVEAEGQPVSVALWRNLGGFPEQEPYRSVGVEPMLGRVFDLAAARDGDAACVPRSGEVRWRLTLAAQAPESWTQQAQQTEPETDTAPEDTDRKGTHTWIC
ncbi:MULTISPECIES: hypothetical protein [unclassified Streptomyces]|uniref:hypothetical protein n=1 Tax=unclassified Streptomyces TaxID=2593676 RepID=UPI00352BE2E0|nr:hypothetical protein OG306_37130 [Streptomyces sp. NBC_01241]